MTVQSYLFFNGRCEEAIEFYRKALGAQVTMMMRFKENPEPMTDGCGPDGGPAPDPNSIMHASFKIGDTEVMASDGMGGGKPEFKGFSRRCLWPATPRRSASSSFWAMAARSRCPWPRPFSHHPSAWWLTASACHGW